MVKSKESTTLGRKFGSSASPAAAETLLMPGNVGCGRVGDAAGIGAVRPSAPTRKAFATLTAPLQVPFRLFVRKSTAWAGTVPNRVTSTRTTPARSPYAGRYEGRRRGG